MATGLPVRHGLGREALVDQLLYELPDIVCLQEVMWHQMEDIDSLVGSIYGHITAGREDGKRQGEVRVSRSGKVSRASMADANVMMTLLPRRHALFSGISKSGFRSKTRGLAQLTHCKPM